MAEDTVRWLSPRVLDAAAHLHGHVYGWCISYRQITAALCCSAICDMQQMLRDSHDCGIMLQHKIESLPEVERCFVHIDYQQREVDDHDPKVR